MSATTARGMWTPPGSLTLLNVCKPHTQAINSLAVDTNGALLATGVSYITIVG